MVLRPARLPISPNVSRLTLSSSGWALPVSVGIDLPQHAQVVRKVAFISAR
jgi:hypothetical protein